MRASYPNVKQVEVDKNVLNAVKNARNNARNQMLKSTRKQIAPEAPFNDYKMRLYKGHGKEVLRTFPVIIALILTTALLMAVFADWLQAIIWLTIATLVYGLLAYVAKLPTSTKKAAKQVFNRTQLIIGLQTTASIVWVALPFASWQVADGSLVVVSELAVLITVVCLTATACISIPGSLLLASAIPVAAFCGTAYLTGDPLRFICAFILLSICGALYTVCDLIHNNRLEQVSAVAERENLMLEVELAQAQSDKARLAAEDASFAKSRFLALISHELRTPLNAIMGFSEVMALEQLGPMENKLYKEYAGDIYKSGEHLLTIINEILDISRIEADRYELHEGPLDLVTIAEACCRMLDIKINSKSITLKREYESNLPLIWADEKSVRQVVLNILSNAIKFTPEGKGMILLRIGWTRGGGQYISVKDNGPGIAEEEIPIVLQPFGQGSIAIRSAEQGTGLGLPIVQGIMKRHGGAFQLKSRLRAGTEAIATFPPSRVTAPDGAVDMAS